MDITTIYRHTMPLFMLTTDEDDFVCMGGERITISKMEVAMPTETNINNLLKIDNNGTFVAKYRLYNPFKENVFKGEPLILKRLSTASSVTSSYLMMLLIDKLLYGLLHIRPNDMPMELETLYSALAPYKGKNKSTTVEVLHKGWMKKAEATMAIPATSVLPIKLGKGVKYKEKTLSAALLCDVGYTEKYSENENVTASLGVIYGFILGNIYKESVISFSDNSTSPGYITLVRGMYKLTNLIKSVNNMLLPIEESYGNNQLTLELNAMLSPELTNIIDELEAIPNRYKLGIDSIPAIGNDGYVDKKDKEVDDTHSKSNTYRVTLPDEPDTDKGARHTDNSKGKVYDREYETTRYSEKHREDNAEEVIEITNMDQVHKHLFKPLKRQNNAYEDPYTSRRRGSSYYDYGNRGTSVLDRLSPTKSFGYDMGSRGSRNEEPVYPGRRSVAQRVGNATLRWDPDIKLHFDEAEDIWVDVETGEIFDIYLSPIRGARNIGGNRGYGRRESMRQEREILPSRRAVVEVIDGIDLLWDPAVRLHFDEKSGLWVDVERGITYNTFMEETRPTRGDRGMGGDRGNSSSGRSRPNGLTLPA